MSNITNINLPGFTDQLKFAAGAQLDVFGKPRFSLAKGAFESKQITSRQISLWEERLWGAIMNVSSLVGTPVVGDTITGATSGKKGVITAVAGTVLTYTTSNNDFTDTENLTIAGVGAGATAVLTNHNTGAHIEYNYYRASSYLKVGTVSGQRVVRRTREYFPYTPKKGQVADRTAVMGAAKANVRQWLLYGDDLNATGFCLDGLILKIVQRSNTSGSVDTQLKPQSEWNVDKLDGFGPSGVTLDPAKIQIFNDDLAWLAAGNGRHFFNVNGQNILVHVDQHANQTAVAWLRTASLPISFEIENIGTAASATQLEQICSSVESDGGYEPPGFEFAVGNETTRVPVTTKKCVLAVRLKNNCPDIADHPNRKTVKYIKYDISTKVEDVYFELVHVHDYDLTSGDWSPLWGDPNIGVEYSVNAVFTPMMEHEIDAGYSVAGQAGKGGTALRTGEGLSYHDRIVQNFESNKSQMFAIYCTHDGAQTASVAATFGGKFLE